MDRLEIAILRTILYGDIFDFPMTAAEIHHFLIHDEALPPETVARTLRESERLGKLLYTEHGYYARADRPEIIALRCTREEAAPHLWEQARRYGRWLARLPFVRMVALTGALTMRNADAGDDLDYMLISEPGRVWLARLFAVILVRVVRLRGVTICPNYVVAADALHQSRQDLFIAHEIAQMVPLFGYDYYHQFRQINLWAEDHLPNAHSTFHTEPAHHLQGRWRACKRTAERLLSGRPGNMLEHWEYRRKLRRFATQMQTPHSAAELDASQVKGHFNDYGYAVMHAYADRLEAFGLIAQPAPGD